MINNIIEKGVSANCTPPITMFPIKNVHTPYNEFNKEPSPPPFTIYLYDPSKKTQKSLTDV